MSTFKISLLHLISSSLRSLRLVILIFSSIHKLHQPLKLFTVEDCLTIFHFIRGVSPWSLRLQKYSYWAIWFLSRGLEKECLVIQSLFPIPSRDTYIDPLSIIIMFHWRNARLVYNVLRVASSTQGAFHFSSTVTWHLSWSATIPI